MSAKSETPCPEMCVYGDVLENINLGIVILNVNQQAVIYTNKTALDIFKNC